MHARLGRGAAQVLAATLLVRFELERNAEAQLEKVEFATLKLGPDRRWSMPAALSELSQAGLVMIIPQKANLLQVHDETHLEGVEDQEPIEMCRDADEKTDRRAQVVALQAVWDATFPVDEYPVQRLTDATAKKWLVGRKALEVAEAILDAVASARKRIEYPRAYIERVLSGRLKESRDGMEEYTITDDLRALVKLGRKQRYENKGQAAAYSGTNQ